MQYNNRFRGVINLPDGLTLIMMIIHGAHGIIVITSGIILGRK